MAQMNLSLRFQDNNSGHKDLFLYLGGESWEADSYYLALDNGLLPEREDAEKVRMVLQRLLQQWLDAVNSLRDNEVIFLPYDFSDQYTAWLRCERNGDSVTVVRGWASVEGWSFNPSNIGDRLNNLPGFKIDGCVISAPYNELLEAIKGCVREAI